MEWNDDVPKMGSPVTYFPGAQPPNERLWEEVRVLRGQANNARVSAADERQRADNLEAVAADLDARAADIEKAVKMLERALLRADA